MTEIEFDKLILRRLSQISTGASAFRNQGASGLVRAAQGYFEHQVPVGQFVNSLSNNSHYNDFLKHHTDSLLSVLPNGAQNWGVARKGLNLFLREIVYNSFLAEKYKIPTRMSEFNIFAQNMEVPLDGHVAKALISKSNPLMPSWNSLKRLTQETSDIYQLQAIIVASQMRTARINLDLKFWRPSASI